jgi:hypothetical protein
MVEFSDLSQPYKTSLLSLLILSVRILIEIIDHLFLQMLLHHVVIQSFEFYQSSLKSHQSYLPIKDLVSHKSPRNPQALRTKCPCESRVLE